MEKYYTIQEVADMLGVSYHTIFNLLSTGKLPGFQVGKQWRITQKQIGEYLNRSLDEDKKKNAV